MRPKINKDLLPIKGHYFLNNAGTAPVVPYMPLYVNSLGFSSVTVGTINSILPFTGMLAKPIFGAVADRFRMHKFIFILFQVITVISFFSIQFIQEISTKDEADVNLVCGSQANFHVDISTMKDQDIIQKVDKIANSGDIVKCHFTCSLSSSFQNEICYHWRGKIPACFNSTIPNSAKNVITESPNVNIKKSKFTDLGKDAYSEKFNAHAADGSVLRFNGTVALNHTEQFANILYFRLSTVVLENDPTVHIPYCLEEIDTNCTVTCDASLLADFLTNKESIKPSDAVHYYQFWLLLLCLIGSWVGMAVVGSITDAICFEMLGVKASRYGNQRLWGSVGWGLFAFLTGVIIDKFSQGQTGTNYRPIFYIMLVVLLCDIACMYSLKYQQTKLSTQILKNVGQLLKNMKVDMFIIWCIFIGMCVGFQWTFLYWYIQELAEQQNEGDRIKTLQGLMSATQTFLGELPSFFLSGWLLKKFGHINVMSGILLVVGIRFILYSFLSNPWWTLPIEILQGSVGLAFATMASYASIVAPPGTEATVQGLVGATFEGIGVSLGSFLGGFFFDKFGQVTTFRIFGLAALVVFVLHVAIQYLLSGSSGLKVDGKDFNGAALYASPNEAVSMLEDT